MLAVAVALAIGGVAPAARAQDAKRTLVIAAQADAHAGDAELVRAVRSALSEQTSVSLMAPPPLDLEAVQLAIDCPDENAHCLREVAERMKARVLIVAGITRNNDEAELRLVYFDAAAKSEPRSVEKSAEGTGADGELKKAAPAMVRELLGVDDTKQELPAPSEAEPETQKAPADAKVDREPASGFRVPVGPIVLGGAGLGAIAGGLIVGALMQKTEDDYAARTIDSETQAMSAEVERERGERQAIVANALLGVGVAAVVAAGVWFALDSTTGDDPPAQAALVPMLGPRTAGLSLIGTWEEGSR